MAGSAGEMKMPPSIKVGIGKVFNFTKPGLEVVTKNVFGSKKFFIIWDTIDKVDVEWGCFQGTVTIHVSTGHRYPFTCGKNAVLLAAATIHRLKSMSQRSRDSGRPTANQEVIQRLGAHPKVSITDEGLMVKSQRGWWKSTFRFVPWSSLVSVTMNADRRSLRLNASVEKDDEDGDDEERAPVPATSGGANQAARVGRARSASSGSCASDESREGAVASELVSVLLRCPADAAEVVYDEIVRLACEGTSVAPLVPDVVRKELSVRLSQAGLTATLAPDCFGRVGRSFLPWRALVQLTWVRSCFGSERLEIEDRLGSILLLRGASLEDFVAVRQSFGREACETDGHSKESLRISEGLAQGAVATGKAGALVKGLEMAEDGLLVTRSGLLGKRQVFLPWARVDGLRLQFGMLGSRAELVTETGNALEAARVGPLASDRLWHLYDKVSVLKYGPDFEAESSGARRFNLDKKDPRFSCVLTNHHLKLVMNRTVQEWDLERVLACYTRKDYRHGQGLILEVAVSNTGRRKVLHVPIKFGDSAQALAADISKRAQARRRLLSVAT
eukprot:TRINITY_DN8353_c0_g5_i1.p1 TRINITY_DN8353_c0_g5~~TRINITY_DN8353_c0_g5_i1.p1  ORF type:complete len:591 (-),score=108.00 TRINITY_DN8353_c0_g5_i1:108-1784(-)